MKKSKRYNSKNSVTQASAKLGRALSAAVLASAIMAGSASAAYPNFNANETITQNEPVGVPAAVTLSAGAVITGNTVAPAPRWTITGTTFDLQQGTFDNLTLIANQGYSTSTAGAVVISNGALQGTTLTVNDGAGSLTLNGVAVDLTGALTVKDGGLLGFNNATTFKLAGGLHYDIVSGAAAFQNINLSGNGADQISGGISFQSAVTGAAFNLALGEGDQVAGGVSASQINSITLIGRANEIVPPVPPAVVGTYDANYGKNGAKISGGINITSQQQDGFIGLGDGAEIAAASAGGTAVNVNLTGTGADTLTLQLWDALARNTFLGTDVYTGQSAGDGGKITGNVVVSASNVNQSADIIVGSKGLIDGNVLITRGRVNLSGNTDAGAAALNTDLGKLGGRISGNVTIADSRVDSSGFSGPVVSLSEGASIGGNVLVGVSSGAANGTTQVHVAGARLNGDATSYIGDGSSIDGNVSVLTGNANNRAVVTVEARGSIGSATITHGDVILNDDAITLFGGNTSTANLGEGGQVVGDVSVLDVVLGNSNVALSGGAVVGGDVTASFDTTRIDPAVGPNRVFGVTVDGAGTAILGSVISTSNPLNHSFDTNTGVHSGQYADVRVLNGARIEENVNISAGAVYVDGPLSAILGDVRIGDGSGFASLNVSGGATTGGYEFARGEVNVGGWHPASGATSTVLGNINITGNHAADNNNINIVRVGGVRPVGGGAVQWDGRGLVTGDINVARGGVDIRGGNLLDGNDATVLGHVSVGSAVSNQGALGIAVSVQSAGSILDGVSVGEGHVIVNGETSFITTGDLDLENAVSINEEGDLTVQNRGSVIGDVSLALGNVDILQRGAIYGDVFIEAGNIETANLGGVAPLRGWEEGLRVHGASSILVGDAFVNNGSVTVIDNGQIDGSVFVRNGHLNIERKGAILGDDSLLLDETIVSVVNGEIRLDDYATIGDVVNYVDTVEVVNGRLLLGVDPTPFNAAGRRAVGWASIYADNVDVIQSSVAIDNHSSITVANALTISADNADLVLNDFSVINGDVVVTSTGKGNVDVLNNSAINGSLDIDRGTVDVIGSSRIGVDVRGLLGATWDEINIGDGNLNVNNDSEVFANVTIEKGNLSVTDSSRVYGQYVDVQDGRIDVLNDSEINAAVRLYSNSVFNVDDSSRISSIDIYDGGILSGSPIIRGDLTNYAGIVSPGLPGNRTGTPTIDNPNGIVLSNIDDAVGTITVQGDYYHGADALYIADIVRSNHFDRLEIDGTAYLQGGDIFARFDRNFKLGYKQRFAILTADNGIVFNPDANGDYTEVSSNLSAIASGKIWGFDWSVINDSLVVETYLKSFAHLDNLTHNQKQVAKALDHAVRHNRLGGVNGLLRHVYNNYDNITDIPHILNELSPEQLTSIFSVNVATAQIQNANIQRRLDDVRAGSTGFSANGFALNSADGAQRLDGVASAANKDGLTLAGWDGKSIVSKEVVAPVYHESRWGFFATGTGEWAQISTTRNAQGQDFTSAGFTIGADYRVSENFVIGINGGYTNTQSDYVHGGGLDVDGGRGGIYASAFSGGAYVDAAVGGGYNSYKTRRHTLGGYANGDSDGAEFNALLGGGYDYKVGGLSIGPVASVQYTFTDLNEFQETGNSFGNLHFRGQSQESLRSYVGVKAAYAINAGGVVIKPEVRAQWKHEYLDNTPSIESRFVGDNYYFTVDGPEVGRDSLVLDAGASIQINPAFSVYAYYTGELARTNYESHAVNGGFRVAF